MGHFSTSMQFVYDQDLSQQNLEVESTNYLINSQKILPKNRKIISFAQKIQPVEPLAVLQKFQQKNELHFYWENPSQAEAIAAMGSIVHTTIEGGDRFVKSRQFIQSELKKIIRKGDINLFGSSPYFFCLFSFFAQTQSEGNYPAFAPATIFLPRWQIWRKGKYGVLVYNTDIDQKENISKALEEIKAKVNSIDWTKQKLILPNQQQEVSKIITFDPSDQFKKSVHDALHLIKRDEFTKVVIASTTKVAAAAPFDLIKSLNNLRKIHPDCYIFSCGNGRGHSFIGASPERLVSIKNKQLVSDALAGTSPRGKTTGEDAKLASLLLKSRKEKREHQAVSDFILNKLKLLGLSPQQLPLQILQLSNIQHLWTPIYAHLPMSIDPLEIVAQLHPTPAVAGVPTKIACDQIRQYETFDRSLYAAPLGWVDYQGNCEFIVGIRSALIKENQAQLYAGAGIVYGSDPDREYDEIQLKLQSLLEALV